MNLTSLMALSSRSESFDPLSATLQIRSTIPIAAHTAFMPPPQTMIRSQNRFPLFGITPQQDRGVNACAQAPDIAGRTIRLSLTARTPGIPSASTRTAFFSAGEATIPHSSTVPFWTIAFIMDVCAHGSAFSSAMNLVRIAVSSGAAAGTCSFWRPASACRRLARLTMPTIFPAWTIGTRLIVCRIGLDHDLPAVARASRRVHHPHSGR